jgi:hypothetical protein
MNSFSGAFAIVAKKHLLAPPCPSVRLRMYQLISHWTGFREIWYWGLVRNFVQKLHTVLKPA